MPVGFPTPGFQRYEFRTRVGQFGEWGGQMRDADPGSLPPNRPRMVVNGLFRNGAIEVRGGQFALNDGNELAADSCVTTLADYQMAAKAVKLWIVGNSCPGLAVTGGFSLLHYDQEQEPAFQRAIYFNAASICGCVAIFDNSLYAGFDSVFTRVALVGVPWGEENFSVSGNSQNLAIWDFPGFEILNMLAFDSRLFLCLGGSGGAPGGSKIVTWDGVTIDEDLTGIDPPTGVGLWREKIAIGFQTTTGRIRLRDIGAPPHAWTTVTHAGVKWKGYGYSVLDILYWSNGVDTIWGYDGTSIAAVRTIVGATNMCIVPFRGPQGEFYLYYAYGLSGYALVGRYDGTTWEDLHKNLSTQFLPTVLDRPWAIQEYRSDLYVIAGGTVVATGDYPFYLYRSERTNTAGDWVEVSIGSLTSTSEPVQMLVF